MKKHWTTQLVSELVRDEKVFDDAAETISEIASKTGRSISQTGRLVSVQVAAGSVEQVWKRINGQPRQAYRVKRKDNHKSRD